MTVCACGCHRSLDGLRSDAVYASDACRKRRTRAHPPEVRTRPPSPDKARTRDGGLPLQWAKPTKRRRKARSARERKRKRS